MKKLLSLLALLVFVGIPLAAFVAANLAIDDYPANSDTTTLTPESIARAKALMLEHDPRSSRPGQLRTVVLTGDDIRAVAGYAFSRFGRGSLDIRLQPREATVQLSVPVPKNLFGTWVNLSALVGETSAMPLVENLRIGRLSVPNWVTKLALRYAVKQLGPEPAAGVASDVIRSVTIGDELLRVEYEWSDALPDRLRSLALSADDADRLRAYNNQIVDVVERLPRRAPLSAVLTPLMQLAHERAGSGDAVSENRAAILALAFYVNGKGLGAIVPGAREWARPIPRTLLLHGREDLPKHFMISAALAATADSPLANAVGLYKEVDDSRGGSGFSFTDIVADRAGTLFGQHALDRTSAATIQARAAATLMDTDIVPALDGLADRMPEAEFVQRFGGVGAPAYNEVIADIEQRLTTSALLQ